MIVSEPDGVRVGGDAAQSTNPLLEAWEAADLGRPDPQLRSRLLSRYSFAVPTEPALMSVASNATEDGIIEIGAGTGYWAHLLRMHGVDVLASDTAPAPSRSNRWFAGSQAWTDIIAADHRVVAQHAGRTLLIIWPTKNEVWAAEALQLFWDAGGQTVIYVGELPGGRTGDDLFHALLGEYDRCWGCSFGIVTMPCICGVSPRFRRVQRVTLPHWPGFSDDLLIYRRITDGVQLQPSVGRRRARSRWRDRPAQAA